MVFTNPTGYLDEFSKLFGEQLDIHVKKSWLSCIFKSLRISKKKVTSLHIAAKQSLLEKLPNVTLNCATLGFKS